MYSMPAAVSAAHSAVKGDYLTVQIGQGDGIMVGKEKLSHAAPGQGLRSVGAHSAKAENGHLAPGQNFHSVCAYQHFFS